MAPRQSRKQTFVSAGTPATGVTVLSVAAIQLNPSIAKYAAVGIVRSILHVHSNAATIIGLCPGFVLLSVSQASSSGLAVWRCAKPVVPEDSTASGEKFARLREPECLEWAALLIKAVYLMALPKMKLLQATEYYCHTVTQ
jgi:hypothetical protein